MSKRILTVLLTVTAVLAAGPSVAGDWGRHTGRFDFGGVVYVMTNDSRANAVLVYLRNPVGRLRPVTYATVSTGGQGGSANAAIDPLGSQGALVYDARHELLFAVNAGSDSVAVLDTDGRNLRPRLRDVEPSGGYIPVSVAVSEDRLYVLNAGGTGSVTTFGIGHHGDIEALGSLDLGLDPAATSIPFGQVPAPNQVGVDTLARHLIVAHAGGKELLTVELDDDGVPAGPITSTTTPGDGPFAFDLTRYGTTLVAEAASGSVSAFDPPSGTDMLTATAAAVPTGQAATCWIIVQDDGYAYVSNTGSNTIGVYAWTRTGQLTLLDATAATSPGAPIDLALANGGGFLYSLDAASGSISGFRIMPGTGALRRVETRGGLPAAAGLQGIAARDF
jgi:6-phosphogluconolactonase (cycloisomerase 2 family)